MSTTIYNWTNKRWCKDRSVVAEFDDGDFSIEVVNDGIDGFRVKIRQRGILKHSANLCHRSEGLEVAKRMTEVEYKKFRSTND